MFLTHTNTAHGTANLTLNQNQNNSRYDIAKGSLTSSTWPQQLSDNTSIRFNIYYFLDHPKTTYQVFQDFRRECSKMFSILNPIVDYFRVRISRAKLGNNYSTRGKEYTLPSTGLPPHSHPTHETCLSTNTSSVYPSVHNKLLPPPSPPPPPVPTKKRNIPKPGDG